jgi:hypothetical protein
MGWCTGVYDPDHLRNLVDAIHEGIPAALHGAGAARIARVYYPQLLHNLFDAIHERHTRCAAWCRSGEDCTGVLFPNCCTIMFDAIHERHTLCAT